MLVKVVTLVKVSLLEMTQSPARLLSAPLGCSQTVNVKGAHHETRSSAEDAKASRARDASAEAPT